MGRKKKEVQEEIPGTERKKIQTIEDAADEYYEKVRERLAIQKEESDLKDKLITAMNANHVTQYRLDDGRVAELEHKDVVKVKSAKGEGSEEE